MQSIEQMSVERSIRGADGTQESLFVVRQTLDHVPKDHPLMAIREIVNQALRGRDRLFASMYEARARYSVRPEWLLRGLVLLESATDDPEKLPSGNWMRSKSSEIQRTARHLRNGGSCIDLFVLARSKSWRIRMFGNNPPLVR